jgi:transposase
MGKNLVVTGVASPWNADIALTLKLLVQLDELRFQVREGAEYFTAPAGAAQRRYEALRAYFTEDMPASEVADRFGYSTASVHQMATLLRKGKLALFTESKPGPKGPRKATGQLRSQVLELRAAGHSVTEIAAALTAEGLPLSAQTCWQILEAEGLPRLARRDEGRRGPPARLEAVKSAKLHGWPEDEVSLPCDHAGLLLLFPAIAQLGLPGLVRAAGYPSTRALSSWQSAGTLLLAKCARKARIHHAGALADDEGLAFSLGLTALPKATHLGTYSWRVRRESNHELLTGLVKALRPLGLATGEAGFNCDFHAIRHHGDQTVLEKHYVPRRSRRTRAVLTFFAQDHASAEMVYANADLTKAGQAAEIIAFADYWKAATGSDPGLVVFDSQLTTYKILDQLTGRGINWLTLRQRGKGELTRLAALPASAWKTVTIARSGRYRRPRLHEDMIKLKDVSSKVRQIAVKNIGHDEPTLLITHDLATPARDLFARYAERMMVENEIDAYIGGFHLDALTSGVPLNVDLDTTLTVVAGNLCRLLARKLSRYENATPDRIWRDFLDATGTLHITAEGVTCALNLRSHHPVLIDAGFADLEASIPWWNERTLRFRFPPR